MSTHCNNKHPLKNPGVHQGQRVLAALLPGYARVDEREYPDLILFAKHYASHLQYYNKHHKAEGDWKPFMLMDVSVTLATLSRLDIQEYISYSKDIYDQIAATDAGQEAELQKYFKTIFDLCFSITTLLDTWYRDLPEDFPFREVLGNAVRSGLPEYFDRLRKYYGEAISQGLLDPQGTFRVDDRPHELILSQEFRAEHLSDIWESPAVPPFTPTFNGLTTALKIKNTASHNLFTGISDQYLKILARMVDAAPAFLEQTLTAFPTHSPHYALFLAFIKLFRYSRESLNTFTARHLDLYYRDILKLEKKQPEPDTVHLLFELAKTAGDGVLLEADTTFKAGRDPDGKELFYRVSEQTLLGKGKVKSLKNSFVRSEAGTSFRRISAGNMANSGDGMGAPLQHDDQSWSAFGGPDRTAGRAGFGIASDYLLLREGTREITFTFQLSEGTLINTSAATIGGLFNIALSAEKDWFEVRSAARETSVAPDRKSFSVKITLDGGDPALLPWSPAVHGYRFSHSLPTALFTLADGAAPEDFWELRISDVTIKVAVEDLKNLLIENDEGALNPAKPFDLFGPAPYKGSTFILGCPEFFMKARRPAGNLEARLSLTWDDYDALTDAYEENPALELQYLEDARWKKEDSFSGGLFTISGETPEASSTLQFQLPALGMNADFSTGGNYTPGSRSGFLKLILKNDFGHAGYAKKLAESIEVISTTDNGTTTTSIEMGEVKEPLTPRVKAISLSYQVSTSLRASMPGEGDFFHLEPFGFKTIGKGNFPAPLLPQFLNEGELFIGLEQLQTGQTLPLLVQVAEGTADPTAVKQELLWHYLGAAGEWKSFRKEDIADATAGLLKSGIIKLSIPAEAAPAADLMGEELHWLKVSAAKNTQAIPRLISIQAQAAAARFYDHKGEGNYFKKPLPPGTISKMRLSNPAIKKVEQPYPSFGGRTREDDASWYRWVSERLRHKQRAVSIWDYERLVLEAFPEIYKVKCVSHARINNELSPGHVMVVPVPDLHGRNAFDPLRPAVSLGLLNDIRKFLSGIASPHVELEVCNPLFEEIQLEFNVEYRSDETAFFTRQLRADLEQFLAPWAFDTGGDMEFGIRISKSALINFIEERPYVDYLSCVKMYCIREGLRSNDLEEALAGSARSVFVSVKAEGTAYPHIINESVCTC